MAQQPLFSIITVTYNAASVIVPTLESVRAQSFTDYEHLIVDGQSTDDTVELAKSSGIENLRITSEADSGIYDAMNRGLDRASGKYVIFMNAGDRFHSPDVLADYARAIMENNYPGIVYGQTVLVDGAGKELGPRHLQAPEKLTLQSFSKGMLVCHQAMAVLKQITSPYDLRYRFSADYEWVIRCLQHSRHNVYVPQTVVDYMYEGATTANRRRSLMERFRIMGYYYGWVPTIIGHLGFVPRFIRHKLMMDKARKG